MNSWVRAPRSERQPGRLVNAHPSSPAARHPASGLGGQEGTTGTVVRGIFIRALRAEKRKSVQVLILESYFFVVFQKSKGRCKELLEGISRAGE